MLSGTILDRVRKLKSPWKRSPKLEIDATVVAVVIYQVRFEKLAEARLP